jgi:hypothetical protein
MNNGIAGMVKERGEGEYSGGGGESSHTALGTQIEAWSGQAAP